MTDQPAESRPTTRPRRSKGPNPWLILLLIFVVVGGGGAALSLTLGTTPQLTVTTTVGPAVGGPPAGTTPPNFRLPGLDSEDRELAELLGRPIMLFFWDSHCQPCLEMMPRLQAAYDAHQGEDLALLGINTAFQDNQDDARAVVKQYSLSFDILLDTTGSAVRQYQVLALPTSFFIRRDGTVSEAITGPLPDETLNAALAKIR